MAIEHRDIPNDGLHEPKGIDTATQYHVYSADGLGSGTWRFVSLDGQDSSDTGQIIVSNGDGTFTWKDQGTMAGGIRNITTSDTQLDTDTLIFTEGTVTLTMLDPTVEGLNALTVKCISGSCTFSPTAGTVEATTISTGSATTLVPRASDTSWREV